jgi:hypothetical protein
MLVTPAMVMGLTPLGLEAHCARACAHVKRWDYLVNVCEIVAETLFFIRDLVGLSRIRVGASSIAT